MNELNDIVREIGQINDYLNDVYQDIESTTYLGEDKDNLVQIEMKGNFEVLDIKWDEKQFNNNTSLLHEKIAEAFNNAATRIKCERQSIVLSIINEKMRF